MDKEPMRLGEWLAFAGHRLSSRLEAEILAAHGLARSRSWLYAHGDHLLNDAEREALARLLKRRAAGEPVAYLTGSREFYGRCFAVSPEVLIPRPETELVVERALALDLPEAARVLDLGTGSGCIALTLAAERPAWRVVATDSSRGALEVAAENRRRLGLERVELRAGDLFAPVAGETFDLIVSNPPYVAAGDPHLERGDLRFEPRAALATSDRVGMDTIRRIAEGATGHLAPGGWLVLEHGHDQAERVGELLRASGFSRIASHHDLAGHPRVTEGVRAN